MKKYETPEILVTYISEEDIITTSPGTETTPKDECDGVWDLDFATTKIQ